MNSRKLNRKINISILNDTDMKQYQFERSSRLPLGYFDRGQWWKLTPDQWVFVVTVVLGLVALAFLGEPTNGS